MLRGLHSLVREDLQHSSRGRGSAPVDGRGPYSRGLESRWRVSSLHPLRCRLHRQSYLRQFNCLRMKIAMKIHSWAILRTAIVKYSAQLVWRSPYISDWWSSLCVEFHFFSSRTCLSLSLIFSNLFALVCGSSLALFSLRVLLFSSFSASVSVRRGAIFKFFFFF